MRVLLVEDDETISDTIERTLLECGIPGVPRISHASNRNSALEALQNGPYDLIVCDRRIPTDSDGLDVADEHGDAVCAAARHAEPGTPIIILTGFADVRQATSLLQTSRTADIFGAGVEHPLTDLVEKDELPKALEKIVEVARQIAKLEEIELAWEGSAGDRLRRTETQVVRLYARQHGGTMGRVRPLGGGLSEARTFGVIIEGPDGGVRARTVAKLGRLDRIADEERRYREHVAALLSVGAYTPLAGKVDVGAGDVGGLFYTLADEYRRSLFEVLIANAGDAAAVVERLAEFLRRWTGSARRQMRSIGDIRRELVSDETLMEKCEPWLRMVDWNTFEKRRVNVNVCSQHGDLHAHNVLVSDAGTPVLIDYGDVKTSTGSLDFSVLELSLLFHPTNVLGRESWPSVRNAEQWVDFDEYANGTELKPFLQACRNAALNAAAGTREVHANVYAYCVRQLKYDDTDKELATAIIRRIVREFEEEDR